MITVREHIRQEIDSHQKKLEVLTKILYNLPVQLDGSGIGELESDSVTIYGTWLILRDSSHKDLGAQIASITDQSVRFKTCGSTRTAVFRDVGPFYKVDFDRPNPKCRRVRVLKPAEERVMEICGDIPAGYELLEEPDDYGRLAFEELE